MLNCTCGASLTKSQPFKTSVQKEIGRQTYEMTDAIHSYNAISYLLVWGVWTVIFQCGGAVQQNSSE